MRSFLSPSSKVARSRADRPGRTFWHKQSGAVAPFASSASSAGPVDTEAAQRALLYRSEAFAEDLGPGYAELRFALGDGSTAAP